VPTWIWNHEREQLDYHLRRIEREGDLASGSLLGQCDFVRLDESFGVCVVVAEVI